MSVWRKLWLRWRLCVCLYYHILKTIVTREGTGAYLGAVNKGAVKNGGWWRVVAVTFGLGTKKKKIYKKNKWCGFWGDFCEWFMGEGISGGLFLRGDFRGNCCGWYLWGNFWGVISGVISKGDFWGMISEGWFLRGDFWGWFLWVWYLRGDFRGWFLWVISLGDFKGDFCEVWVLRGFLWGDYKGDFWGWRRGAWYGRGVW